MAPKYEPIDIKISFWANPKEQTLDIEELGKGNFQWIAYGLLFKVDEKDDYYAYSVKLDPDGSPQGAGELYASDSAGGLRKDVEIDITPSDVDRLLPKLFKNGEPILIPKADVQVIYINTHPEDKKHIYSDRKFSEEFDKDHYVVVTKGNQLKNPFGKVIGRKGEKLPTKESATDEVTEAIRSVVRRAIQKKSYMSGGFDIMKKFQKKELKKQKKKKKT